MNPELNPGADDFARTYNKGNPQIVWVRLVNDLDTPVSAFLKLAADKPYAFLFESVQGGEQRGRYSVLGYAPDMIWQVRGNNCEMSMDGSAFITLTEKPIDSLRQIQAQAKLEIPDELPPMAAGLFGYLGYDMIRQVEHLPASNPDPINTPDAIMTRPTIIAIFDQIAQEVILTTTIRPSKKLTAATAYALAKKRLTEAASDLESGTLALRHQNIAREIQTPNGGLPQAEFTKMVKAAKEYIEAGDIFQVVLGQRFEAPLPEPPFALYRALRRLNPSPFLYYLNFEDHAVVGSSPEILVRLRDETVTIRPIAGTRVRGKTPAEDKALELDLLADEKEMAEHLMLLDLGRNDMGRVAKPGTIKVTERSIVERYSHVMHIVSNVEGQVRDGLDAIDCLFAG
ncbi:MAG: chorismate-binding protein, partial [Robiginitomaculum sp.]|nr:chorismate-binding protein [Robiginitomaculum sp.]